MRILGLTVRAHVVAGTPTRDYSCYFSISPRPQDVIQATTTRRATACVCVCVCVSVSGYSDTKNKKKAKNEKKKQADTYGAHTC